MTQGEQMASAIVICVVILLLLLGLGWGLREVLLAMGVRG
jgi:hypothetical protein